MVILCSEASLVWGKDAVFQTAQMDIKKRDEPRRWIQKTDVGSGAFLPLSFLDYLISLPHEPNFLKFFFYNVPRLDVFQCSLSCRPQK